MNQLCPCGSQKIHTDCCQPIISGKRNAATALELMRSRYVAFTQANGDYLMRSHHSKTRPIKEKDAIEEWAKSVQWMGLTILNTQDGQDGDSIGHVEFKAFYTENGQIQHIHENSLFKKEQNRWVYYSGVHNS